MEAKDLRIGNWVYLSSHKKDIGEVHLGFNNTNLDLFEPIELTEEWLLKFGFWYDGNQQEARYNISMMGYDCVLIEGKRAFEFWVDDEYCLVDIKYVHELQNLYKVLTGGELTIK